jgi:hypothetical protein
LFRRLRRNLIFQPYKNKPVGQVERDKRITKVDDKCDADDDVLNSKKGKIRNAISAEVKVMDQEPKDKKNAEAIGNISNPFVNESMETLFVTHLPRCHRT